ncbi:hypothetical protein HNY73_007825 [Argiope bruennichi]|uniref:Uncharacterized protein n=1 Tax=Argiope bruennichi TaxID=94029 RepID=A0A8T0FAZ6_ARGBR|nr:hypothetical protein HNY73_007825 [Argiope bruennichi]
MTGGCRMDGEFLDGEDGDGWRSILKMTGGGRMDGEFLDGEDGNGWRSILNSIVCVSVEAVLFEEVWVEMCLFDFDSET